MFTFLLQSTCVAQALGTPSSDNHAHLLQEVLLHETVVAWVRSREKVTQPKYPWTETEAQYGSRLRGICQYINQNYDVDGLCRALLKRVQKVVDAGGGRRINH